MVNIGFSKDLDNLIGTDINFEELRNSQLFDTVIFGVQKEEKTNNDEDEYERLVGKKPPASKFQI